LRRRLALAPALLSAAAILRRGGGGVAIKERWFLIARAAVGAVIAAASRLLGSVLLPVAEAIRAAPEVEKAYQAGYEISLWREQPSQRFTRYGFVARRRGRQVGWLDADFIQQGRRLYARNVYVVEAHRRNGVAAALLVAAAKTTDCSVISTTGRTADGAAYCLRMRSILKRHGIELRDGPF
jgi:GNAT superfamily N-acetyltransferase